MQEWARVETHVTVTNAQRYKTILDNNWDVWPHHMQYKWGLPSQGFDKQRWQPTFKVVVPRIEQLSAWGGLPCGLNFDNMIISPYVFALGCFSERELRNTQERYVFNVELSRIFMTMVHGLRLINLVTSIYKRDSSLKESNMVCQFCRSSHT